MASSCRPRHCRQSSLAACGANKRQFGEVVCWWQAPRDRRRHCRPSLRRKSAGRGAGSVEPGTQVLERRLSRSAERSRTTRHARCAPARHATATVARVTPCDSVARGYTDTNTDMYVYIWTPGRVVRVADRWAERHENEAGDAKVQAGRRDTVAPMPAAAARGRGRGRGARGRHSRGPGQAVAFRSLMPIPPLPTVSSSDNAATSTSATAPG